MSTSAIPKMMPLAKSVTFTKHEMAVQLADGRNVTAPLEWFPRLRDATPEQRADWRLIGDGIGLHWEELDEDISVAGLLAS